MTKTVQSRKLDNVLHVTRFLNFYRPQTKFAKVMFLQVSVCPHGGHAWFYSVGGGMRGFIWGGMRGFIWGACVVLFGGHAWFYLGGMCGFIWGGMHGFIRGGICGFIRGACMVLFRGGCVWFFQFFQIQWDTVNERAVRILLECILVWRCIHWVEQMNFMAWTCRSRLGVRIDRDLGNRQRSGRCTPFVSQGILTYLSYTSTESKIYKKKVFLFMFLQILQSFQILNKDQVRFVCPM